VNQERPRLAAASEVADRLPHLVNFVGGVYVMVRIPPFTMRDLAVLGARFFTTFLFVFFWVERVVFATITPPGESG
jgi:hypothetical protein